MKDKIRMKPRGLELGEEIKELLGDLLLDEHDPFPARNPSVITDDKGAEQRAQAQFEARLYQSVQAYRNLYPSRI